jgi:hypothetical protein
MRNGLLAVALMAVLTVCCGCFEYSQEIWVNPDYSGRIVADFGISEQLLSMSALGGGDPAGQVRAGYEKNKAELQADPNVKSVSLAEKSDDSLHHFIFDVSLKDVTKLGRVGEAMEPDPGALGGDAPQGRPAFELTRVKGGDISFHMSLSGMAQRPREGGDAFSGMGEAMGLSMLSGRYFTVTLHAPKFTSTNGELSEDKRTATWKISLAELMSGKGAMDDLQAEIDMPNPLRLLIIAAAALLALIAIVLIVSSLLRKRKPRAPVQYPTAPPPAPPASDGTAAPPSESEQPSEPLP